MGLCRKIQYLAERRKNKKKKAPIKFNCSRRQKSLKTKRMERAEPKLFNEYFVSNNILIYSDFLKLRTQGSEWIFIILFLSAFISDAKRDTLLAYLRTPCARVNK